MNFYVSENMYFHNLLKYQTLHFYLPIMMCCLMILNSNPLENIRNTLDIKYVMKGGRLYDGFSLDELWPRQVPFGPAYWVNNDALQKNVKASTIFDKKP